MKNEVKDIILEHLKLLAETAEDCEEENLGTITNAMVAAAYFLTEKEIEK